MSPSLTPPLLLPIVSAFVWQNSDCVLLARLRSVDGTYLQQSQLTSIALTVYDRNNNLAVVTGPIALVIANVVFNTLQPWDGVLWTVDRVGWNFEYRLAGAAAFPNAGDYRVDVIFTLIDGTVFPLQYNLSAQSVP